MGKNFAIQQLKKLNGNNMHMMVINQTSCIADGIQQCNLRKYFQREIGEIADKSVSSFLRDRVQKNAFDEAAHQAIKA